MASIIRAVKSEIATVKARVLSSSTYGPVAAFFTFFQGRATTFAILFAIEGVVLLGVVCVLVGVAIHSFLRGKDISGIAAIISALAGLVASLAAFNGLIQTMAFAHSAKEDWMALKQQQVDQQNAININNPPTGSAS